MGAGVPFIRLRTYWCLIRRVNADAYVPVNAGVRVFGMQELYGVMVICK